MVGPGTARVRLAIVNGGAQNCWMVQAGAFADRDTADQIRASLERESHSVRITTAPNGLHRVRAGAIPIPCRGRGAHPVIGGNPTRLRSIGARTASSPWKNSYPQRR